MDPIETILARYRGEARLQRLLWVAFHPTPSTTPATQTAAYQAAAQQMKQAGNVHRYKEVIHNTNTNSSNNNVNNTRSPDHKMTFPGQGSVVYDAAWVHETEQSNRMSRDILTSRLQAAQAHLNKEAIRAGYLAIAEHDSHTGDLTEAFHAVLRAKDYCTSRNQTGQVSLAILELSLHLKNFAQVKEYVTKLEHTLGNNFESATAVSAVSGPAGGASPSSGNSSSASLGSLPNKVLTASALERLAAGDFAKAAEKFAAVAKNGQVEWDSVLAPEDVALYAAFLSLAVESRSKMVALAEHPEALELQPAAREALVQFGRRAAYQTCWKILEDSLFEAMKMDLYMAQHLPALQQMIREKCVLQYWQAYQRVELSVMATDLSGLVVDTTSGDGGNNENNDSLLDLLVHLIRQGKIGPDTRIDMRTRTVVRDEMTADDAEMRLQNTKSKLRNVTGQVLDDTYSSIIRLACLEHDLSVVDAGQLGNNSKRRGGVRGGNTSGTTVDGVYDLSGDYRGGGGELMGLMGETSDDEDYDTPMVDVDEAMNPEDLY